MKLIFKICSSDLWREAQEAGRFTGAPIDLEDGYIHFSSADQVRETAGLHFSGQQNLLLIAVDADELGDELHWETSRGDVLFPHLFRDLALCEVLWVEPLGLGLDGSHKFPDRVA